MALFLSISLCDTGSFKCQVIKIFKKVNINNASLKTLLTLNKKEAYKDNQSIIYELNF
jgi:DNA uptake protein ComE-like DNA-binding protein